MEPGRVRVSGSRFVRSDGYQVKLEGVEKVGYRTVSLAGCRDPFMIAAIDDIVESVTQRALDNFEMDRRRLQRSVSSCTARTASWAPSNHVATMSLSSSAS